ncbi:DUF2336 domain-containing protein [Devosia sp. MC1541]|uniref:DUF2336 domain-containing protein n=1 Tax=Devosia sp. MC1541 TaxID=2725264 RepID=UPI00145EC4B6|nr:DUF2336 domain-containing protein [Devosia sp. MC1541]
MGENDNGQRAFASFRVLTTDSDTSERTMLFRNMAQLFSFVSDRCDDDQVNQYDEALCRLAEYVEIEARAHVAKILAPLERAPGTVVLRLANDAIEVAHPLLEFSTVLSDDDLIDIIANQSEEHRIAIASRNGVNERVGEAIVEHGDGASVVRLVQNPKAEFARETLAKLIKRAQQDAALADDLRGRNDIDWSSVRNEIDEASEKVLQAIPQANVTLDPVTASKINAVVYNRLRARAGFNAQEWKVAYNQVKGLADRRQLDDRALARFARFGYGHHSAAGIAVMLKVGPEIVVRWLASQDYAALTVALKALGLNADLYEAIVATLPWRDLPSEEEKRMVLSRFKALELEDAREIFALWRAHSFRKKGPSLERYSA